MRSAGMLIMVLGALAVVIAFGMDTTVYSAGTIIGGSYVGGGSSHNLGLLQKQMMTLHLGLAAFIAGAVLLAAPASGHESTQISSTEPPDAEEDDERLRRNRIAVAIGIVIVVIVLAIMAG